MTAPGVVVVKVGGEVLESEGTRRNVLAQVAEAAAGGWRVVVVHGGGRAVDEMASRVGLTPSTVEGLRVTDEPMLEIVVNVLAGWVNTSLVAEAVASGVRAVGLTGADGGWCRVDAVSGNGNGNGHLGFVGVPAEDGDASLIEHLLDAGFVPFVASVAAGSDGQLYNVNADHMAAAVARLLRADVLLFVSGPPGVMDDRGELLRELSFERLRRLRNDGVAWGGMLPKLDACQQAVDAGVGRVMIVGAAFPAALSAALNGGDGVGTRVTQ